MRTKVSAWYREQSFGIAGFQLYYYDLDTHAEVETEPTICLRLDGVCVQLETLNGVGVSDTVEKPREVAVELGLVPGDSSSSNHTNSDFY